MASSLETGRANVARWSGPRAASNASDDGMASVLEARANDPVAEEIRSFVNALDEDQQIDLVDTPVVGDELEVGPGAVRLMGRELLPHEIQRIPFPGILRFGDDGPVADSVHQSACRLALKSWLWR